MTFELYLITAARAVVEVALFSLLGQGIIGMLSGASRERNPVYRMFSIVTRPPIRLVRLITPRFVLERHIPGVAFALLFWIWIVLAYVKRTMCAAAGYVC